MSNASGRIPAGHFHTCKAPCGAEGCRGHRPMNTVTVFAKRNPSLMSLRPMPDYALVAKLLDEGIAPHEIIPRIGAELVSWGEGWAVGEEGAKATTRGG